MSSSDRIENSIISVENLHTLKGFFVNLRHFEGKFKDFE